MRLELLAKLFLKRSAMAFNPNSSLDEPAMRNQGVVGRVLTRHVGLKPDLRSNELSGFNARISASK